MCRCVYIICVCVGGGGVREEDDNVRLKNKQKFTKAVQVLLKCLISISLPSLLKGQINIIFYIFVWIIYIQPRFIHQK